MVCMHLAVDSHLVNYKDQTKKKDRKRDLTIRIEPNA